MYMSKRKVICTGNPSNNNLIASGIQKLFPDATFIHKSAGWDFENSRQDDELKQLFKSHNTFINASWINNNTQIKLLNLCNQSCKFCDVVNIGSTHEFDGGGEENYINSKLALRSRSLELNTFRFKTVHLMLGGIRRDSNASSNEWLTVDEISAIIKWTLEQRYQVPLMCIDQPKEAW